MSNRLAEKICLITGIASGIGQRAAHMFAAQGAHVIGCDVNNAGAEATAAAVRAVGGRIDVMPGEDLASMEACRRLVTAAEQVGGGLDVLFNNAAMCKFEFMDGMETTDMWDFTIKYELDLAFYMCLAVWPALKRRGRGSIINVGSLAAHRATPAVGNVAHMAAKAGVVAMTKQLALEGGKHRIRVNSVSPGPVATAQSAFLLETDEYRELVGEFLVLGRVGQPADIAAYALFLATDEADWVTGTDLLIDGGHAVL